MHDDRLLMRLEDTIRQARRLIPHVPDTVLERATEIYKDRRIEYDISKRMPMNPSQIDDFLLERNRFCYEPTMDYIRSEAIKRSDHR